MKKKIDLNKYWLQTNKMHRDLTWMSYVDWDEETAIAIKEATDRVKRVLNILTKKVEK